MLPPTRIALLIIAMYALSPRSTHLSYFNASFALHLSLQAESVVPNRPRKDLVAYLHAVDKLRSVECFFNSKRSYRTSDSVLKHVDELLSKAAVGLENEFHRLLSRCRFSSASIIRPCL